MVYGLIVQQFKFSELTLRYQLLRNVIGVPVHSCVPLPL